jgi:hypothetical protein
MRRACSQTINIDGSPSAPVKIDAAQCRLTPLLQTLVCLTALCLPLSYFSQKSVTLAAQPGTARALVRLDSFIGRLSKLLTAAASIAIFLAIG